jgi:hypothetical protein
MGTLSTKKFFKNSAGVLTEEAALTTSAGAGDADKIPALNASGILDSSIVNSKTTSAGAGDSGKLAALNASGILDSTIVNSKNNSEGAGDAGKLVALDSSGKISDTMMPVGVGADALTLTASENVAAGDFVNVWNSSGPKIRKADAATAGKEAHGFVLSAISQSASGTVYFEGTNTAVTGQTPGPVFLSAATAGQAVSTAPSASGNVVQRIGFAVAADKINFQSQAPFVLA